MKPVKTPFVVAVIMLLATDLFAQAKPNFAGTWRLDASLGGGGGRGDRDGRASGGGGGRGGGIGLGAPPDTVTLQQNAGTLTVQQQVGDKTEATVYRLDGQAEKIVMSIGPARERRKADAVASTRWQGTKLVTTFRIAAAAAGGPKPVEYREVRSLDSKGNMVVETTMRGGTGRRTAVYKRAK